MVKTLVFLFSIFMFCILVVNQVKRNDIFTFQLCKECYLNLKFSCKFKKLCRTSDNKFKTFLALKSEGENIDFSTYLRNTEDALSLRFPIASPRSTPHKKNYDDDDNESTCTSIQNFMSDMLQGEEVLPTEARIIREVIQEEADILDESLDSHWLRDDVSVDNDFGMDFNFTGFSTPHSIDNDHCYTPRRFTNDNEDNMYYYTPKYTVHEPKEIFPHDQKDIPLLEISDNNNIDLNDSKYELINILASNNLDLDSKNQIVNTVNQNGMLLIDCNVELDGIIDDHVIINDLENRCNAEYIETPNKEQITVILSKGVASKVPESPLTKELEYYMNKVELNKMTNTHMEADSKCKSQTNEKHFDTILNQNESNLTDGSIVTQNIDQYMDIAKLNVDKVKDIQNVESPVKCELNQYISRVELKKKLNLTNQSKNSNKYNEKCSIDRNLEMALKHDDSQEFSLDQLLISPQVSIRSGASTPTINDILFGNLTPKDTNKIVTDLGNIVVKTAPEATDFIEEFLKDSPRQSTPKKYPKEVERRKFIAVKDLNKLKESKLEKRRKVVKGDFKGRKEKKSNFRKERKTGFKDIRKLKDLIKFENGSDKETSDMEILDSELSESIPEPGEDNYKEVLKSAETDQLPKVDEDLDVSISNLLNCDDNQSADLNISISSDFLKEDKVDDDEGIPESETLFKMPFSPPDNKYDLTKKLCKICDKTFKSKCALKQHFVKIHKQQLPRAERVKKPVELKICPKCGKQFRDKSYFNRHIKQHEEPDSYKCKYCTLEFPTRGRFNQHMRSHASEIAEKETTDLVNNEQDKEGKSKQNEEETPSKKYVCATCGKVFKFNSNYHMHMRRHNKVYTMKCDVCQKGFVRKYDLDVHMATHTNDYPFVCQYCPKKYRSRYLLVGHMYQHLGKYKYGCEVCDRKFISLQSLKQHYGTEMCVRKRKALEDGREVPDISVTYKPYVHKPKDSKEITESAEDISHDESNAVEIKTEEFCLELVKEEEMDDESSNFSLKESEI